MPHGLGTKHVLTALVVFSIFFFHLVTYKNDLGPASNPDVSLSTKMWAQRRAGRRQWARRRFACRLYPSHGPSWFITSRWCFEFASTVRKTKRLRRRMTWDYAAIKCGMHVGSVLSPENFILKNSFFNYGMFQRFTRITNSLTIFTKQYMLIASAKNLKRYLQFNPDELQWLSGARKSSVTCCQFNREGEWTHNLRRLHILRLQPFQTFLW